MSKLLAPFGYLLLTPLALLLILAFVVYRAAQFFLLPHPRRSARGWCTVRQL